MFSIGISLLFHEVWFWIQNGGIYMTLEYLQIHKFFIAELRAWKEV